MVAELFHADRQTDRKTDRQADTQADVTKLTVAFRTFVNAPNSNAVTLSQKI